MFVVVRKKQETKHWKLFEMLVLDIDLALQAMQDTRGMKNVGVNIYNISKTRIMCIYDAQRLSVFCAMLIDVSRAESSRNSLSEFLKIVGKRASLLFLLLNIQNNNIEAVCFIWYVFFHATREIKLLNEKLLNA